MDNFELDYIPIYDPDIVDLSRTNAVRAVCFTLDNQITEMITTLPGVTSWGEPLEVAARKLEETLKYLTMRYTAFKAYQIQIGMIDQDGLFVPTIKYPVKQFPIREQWEGSFVNDYTKEDRKEIQFLTEQS